MLQSSTTIDLFWQVQRTTRRTRAIKQQQGPMARPSHLRRTSSSSYDNIISFQTITSRTQDEKKENEGMILLIPRYLRCSPE
jgi:hypothetical protein